MADILTTLRPPEPRGPHLRKPNTMLINREPGILAMRGEVLDIFAPMRMTGNHVHRRPFELAYFVDVIDTGSPR